MSLRARLEDSIFVRRRALAPQFLLLGLMASIALAFGIDISQATSRELGRLDLAWQIFLIVGCALGWLAPRLRFLDEQDALVLEAAGCGFVTISCATFAASIWLVNGQISLAALSFALAAGILPALQGGDILVRLIAKAAHDRGVEL